MKCPASRIVEQIGDRWKLHIFHQLVHGPHRTQTLLANLKGISSRTLSAKLKALEAGGWISRRVYPEVPPRVEYALTEKGRKLMPLLTALKQTGEALFPRPPMDCAGCQRLTVAKTTTVRQLRPPRATPRPAPPIVRHDQSDDEVVLL